jgi:8-hydroxy-5-deazaflavin:NADPH oxidoreductase
MTKVSIIGSGNMARGIATRALRGGNSVQVIDRDERKAEALAEDLDGDVETGTIGAALTGDLVVLAVPYQAAASVVETYADQLGGRVIVDITNPVDFETFDRVVTPPDSSAAEEIARVAPAGAPVVKAFNTTFAGTLAGDQELDVLIAGNDEDAKAKVASLVDAAGMRAVDAGPLRRAQQLEQAGFLHMALQDSLGTGYRSTLRFT